MNFDTLLPRSKEEKEPPGAAWIWMHKWIYEYKSNSMLWVWTKEIEKTIKKLERQSWGAFISHSELRSFFATTRSAFILGLEGCYDYYILYYHVQWSSKKKKKKNSGRTTNLSLGLWGWIKKLNFFFVSLFLSINYFHIMYNSLKQYCIYNLTILIIHNSQRRSCT